MRVPVVALADFSHAVFMAHHVAGLDIAQPTPNLASSGAPQQLAAPPHPKRYDADSTF